MLIRSGIRYARVLCPACGTVEETRFDTNAV